MLEPETYEDIREFEKRFIAADENERLVMLTDENTPKTEVVLALGIKTLALAILSK